MNWRKGEELNGLNDGRRCWIARLAFAMGDSSHVDDEREGGLPGASGREDFQKGNKSWGHVASACGRK